MHLKMSSAKRRPFFPGGNELTKIYSFMRMGLHIQALNTMPAQLIKASKMCTSVSVTNSLKNHRWFEIDPNPCKIQIDVFLYF